MSTESNAALAWPVEVTEYAAIGDHVARLYVRTAEETDPEQHFGAYLWNLTADERPMFALLGTTWPGQLYSYSPWAESRVSERIDREFAGLYEQAGIYRDQEYTRPFVGDPRMDPTILEEGCWVPWRMPVQMFTTGTWFTDDQIGVE